MYIQYLGDRAVSIPGHDRVEPGDIVDVDDVVGASLLMAGGQDRDGEVIVDTPLWAAPSTSPTVPAAPPPPAPTDAPAPTGDAPPPTRRTRSTTQQKDTDE